VDVKINQPQRFATSRRVWYFAFFNKVSECIKILTAADRTNGINSESSSSRTRGCAFGKRRFAIDSSLLCQIADEVVLGRACYRLLTIEIARARRVQSATRLRCCKCQVVTALYPQRLLYLQHQARFIDHAGSSPIQDRSYVLHKRRRRRGGGGEGRKYREDTRFVAFYCHICIRPYKELRSGCKRNATDDRSCGALALSSIARPSPAINNYEGAREIPLGSFRERNFRCRVSIARCFTIAWGLRQEEPRGEAPWWRVERFHPNCGPGPCSPLHPSLPPVPPFVGRCTEVQARRVRYDRLAERWNRHSREEKATYDADERCAILRRPCRGCDPSRN